MANVFSTKKSVFFVGGTGQQNEGSSTCGGCTKDWYDSNFSTLTDIMGYDGGALCGGIQGTPSGGDTLTAGIGNFTGAEAGMVAYLSGTNVTTGRYEILTASVNVLTFPAGTFVEGAEYVADVICNVGGAFDTQQNAMDNCPAADFDVYLLDNILVQAPAATLDRPTGSVANNSHFIGIGFHTTPPTNENMDNGDMDRGGTYYQSAESALQVGVDTVGERCISIDGSNAERHILEINNDDNQIFRNYYFHNAHQTAHNCVNILNNPINLTFDNCKFNDAYSLINSGSSAYAAGLTMNDCYFGNDYNYAYQLYAKGNYGGSWHNCIFNLDGKTYGTRDEYGSFTNCIFFKGAYGSAVVRATNFMHCVFYGQTSACILMMSPSLAVAKGHSNIFSPAAANDYAILASGQNGSANSVYLTNSCVYSVQAGAEVTTHVLANSINSELADAIEADPMFVDAENKDFRLKSGSPCLNTGKRTIGEGYGSIGIYQRKQSVLRGVINV